MLFACVGNAARSQMAEGWARALARDAVRQGRLEVRSGGSRPAGSVATHAVTVMQERGIDLAIHHSKGFDEPWVAGCDLIVTMGCGDDACPAFVGKRIIDWDLDDPKGKPVEEFRRVRDDIEARMRALLSDLRLL